MKSILYLLPILIWILPSTAHASSPPPERHVTMDSLSERSETRNVEDVRFSGQLFTRYGWNTTGTETEKNFNSFALDRWYLTAEVDLSEQLEFRGTTDVVPADPNANLGYTVIVKFAYFDWELQPWLNLRTGVHQTGWPNYVTGIWGYRGVSKTMAHHQGHLSTSDLGASLTAQLPDEWGSFAVGLHNGRGFRNLEADRFKDVSGRLMLTPFARQASALSPVQVGSHVYRGRHTDGRTRLRWGGLVGYDGAEYTLAVNYEFRRDGSAQGHGVSTFGELQLGSLGALGEISVIGLLDAYDPDDAVNDDWQLRSVVGLAAHPLPGLTIALNHQQTRAQSAVFDRYDDTMTDVDASLFLHAIVKY